MKKKKQKFDIYVREDRIRDKKKHVATILAIDKQNAIEMYCRNNNNVWVSAQPAKQ